MQCRHVFSLISTVSAGSCTGLIAGPESSAVSPVSVSRDSAYVRARRGMQAEAFTMDIADSLAGHIVGTRYPSSNAGSGSPAACRVRVVLDVDGNSEKAQVATTSRWLAPESMQEQASKVCEEERTDVLSRVAATIEPPAAQ